MDYSDDDTLDDIEEYNLICSDDGDDFDYGFAEENREDDSTSISNRSHQIGYVVLKEEDISNHQKKDIEQVSTILSLTQVEAIILLLHYGWSVSKIEDEWFSDEERVRKLVGLLKEPLVNDVKGRREVNTLCGICFDSQKEVEKVSCGHPYCKTCWTDYITTKIKDGQGCLTIKCPEPCCCAVIGQDMIFKLTKKKYKKKYYRYFLRSYVEQGNKKIKWCPSPGCEYAIKYDDDGSNNNYDVTCLCSYSFCWNCCEDAHRPVDCGTVAKWIFKNNDEAENTNWILHNSKPCPKCRRPIEKNQGCNHMLCSICKHNFCWICFSPWPHKKKKCNKFVINKDENKREMARNAIVRYTHYYERWAGNQSSRVRAIKDLKKLQSVQLKEICFNQSTSEIQLQFIVEAWLQIIECRRVMKWTYAYGYYLPEHEKAKKQLFEYLQGEAESGLERLHHCAEMELKQFVKKNEAQTQSFDYFRTKLTNLTKVTKTYFENLVEALENGLVDVACI